MANDWIIDVLTDLKAYAERNGLDATMDVLDDARLIALTELASQSGGKAETTRAHEGITREHPFLVAGSDHA